MTQGPYRTPDAPARPLGPEEREVRPRAVGFVILTAFFAVAGGFDLWLLGNASPGEHPPSREAVWLMYAILAFLPLGFAALFGHSAVDTLRTRLVFYADGVELRVGRKVERARWDEIEWVRSMIVQNRGGRIYTTELGLPGGRKLAIPRTMPQPDAILREVQSRALAHILPRALAQFAEGKAVDFPPFVVSRRGLEYAGLTYPWSEVSEPVAVAGWVSFQAGPRPVRVTAGEIPNLLAFLELVARARAGR